MAGCISNGWVRIREWETQRDHPQGNKSLEGGSQDSRLDLRTSDVDPGLRLSCLHADRGDQLDEMLHHLIVASPVLVE